MHGYIQVDVEQQRSERKKQEYFFVIYTSKESQQPVSFEPVLCLFIFYSVTASTAGYICSYVLKAYNESFFLFHNVHHSLSIPCHLSPFITHPFRLFTFLFVRPLTPLPQSSQQ